jgi:hypothetical protein
VRAVCEEGCDFPLANTFLGEAALGNNTTGIANTAVGHDALSSNTTGNDDTAIGPDALNFNTTGSSNTATGATALKFNTTGGSNTATGSEALYVNNTGNNNTATGDSALLSNTTGNDNTATGFDALYRNTTGFSNTANGVTALYSNTIGLANTGSGYSAIVSNTTGSFNTATGVDALQANTTGNNNTANGYSALLSNTTGSSNIALGVSAGTNLTTGSNNIDIGNNGAAGDFARIRIGTRPTHKNTFIAGIFGVTVPTGVAVLVDNSGHLGTTTSSARFKEAIKPMDKASESILALKPVTFRYKQELDPQRIAQFGLVAEEVEKVNPDLVARDDEGKPYTVRYEAVNAMLLNEFLKAHHKIDEQAHVNQQQEAINSMLESTVARQQQEIKALTANVKEQALQIQKVSARLEVTKPAPQMVLNIQ